MWYVHFAFILDDCHFPPQLNDDQFYHDGQHSHTLVLMRMPVTRLRSDTLGALLFFL